MGLKKRAPIDKLWDDGALMERRFRHCGDVETYWGSKGNERLREKWVARNGSTRYYEGDKGEERLTSIHYPCGKVVLYTGERGEERLDQIHYADDLVEYYHGARGRERVLYTCTEAEDDAFHSDDETPYEWQTHRTGEENMQRERMRQAVLERRQGPLREALKTCTNAREFHCCGVTYQEVHDILKENATNVLKGKIEAIKPRITDDEYAELTCALEAYSAFVR